MIKLLTLDISYFTDLGRVGLLEKSNRQNWFYNEQRTGPGSPTRFYPLETLPDDVQMAWAGWDEDKHRTAKQTEEVKGDSGRPDKIPLPVSPEQAKQALSMPIRRNWQMVWPPGKAPKKNKKVYDGKSKGLCPQAREVLLRRFPELKDIKPGKTIVAKVNQSPRHEPRQQGYPDIESDSAMMVAESQLETELGFENPTIRELQQEIAELKEDKADCREDKKFLREQLHEKDQALKAKDRIIEEMKLQIGRQARKIEELHEKFESILESVTTQKREILPESTGNKSPSTAKHTPK